MREKATKATPAVGLASAASAGHPTHPNIDRDVEAAADLIFRDAAGWIKRRLDAVVLAITRRMVQAIRAYEQSILDDDQALIRASGEAGAYEFMRALLTLVNRGWRGVCQRNVSHIVPFWWQHHGLHLRPGQVRRLWPGKVEREDHDIANRRV